jgi:hypothetical protein
MEPSLGLLKALIRRGEHRQTIRGQMIPSVLQAIGCTPVPEPFRLRAAASLIWLKPLKRGSKGGIEKRLQNYK